MPRILCRFHRPFLSTLSLRRATAVPTLQPWHAPNFYPRSPCGERLLEVAELDQDNEISIHALLAESDVAWLLENTAATRISIHALLAESDHVNIDILITSCKFLSTLSLRRATIRKRQVIPIIQNFYPRSPCGERLLGALWVLLTQIFLSTLSLRRATRLDAEY